MINSEKDSLSIPDYSAFINTLTIQSKELEDSYAIQRQITAPTEEWVITRLGRVADVANIDPVTEENDPNGNLNKPGGYTSTVYFGTALLGTQNLSGNPLIDEGTDAGGAVETYRTAEEAETRNNYLASFDGAGMFSSGSHMVLGTMVIRTSDDLKASQQETLTNAIIAAMTFCFGASVVFGSCTVCSLFCHFSGFSILSLISSFVYPAPKLRKLPRTGRSCPGAVNFMYFA